MPQPSQLPTASATPAVDTPSTDTIPSIPSTTETTSKYIVFLDSAPGSSNANVGARVTALLNSLDAGNQPGDAQATSQPLEIWEYLNGFAIELTETKARRLQALGGIESIEVDSEVRLVDPLGSSKPSQDPITGMAFADQIVNNETIPWGTAAVWNTKRTTTNATGTGKYAFVIDTGVSSSTGDLNVNIALGKSWISGTTTEDDNFHGTHVAGTIAALANNGKGIVGVAPGATVVPLKVLNSSGSGSLADAVSAVNYALKTLSDNLIPLSSAVVNLSLGARSTYKSLDTAIVNAANQGLRFTVAAGNDGQDADNYTPARTGDHPNVFTVSAVDKTLRMTFFSNWDKASSRDIDDVDFAAPGAGVVSLGGGKYAAGSLIVADGTSMAAPHMAGLILLGGFGSSAMVTPYYAGTADPFASLLA